MRLAHLWTLNYKSTQVSAQVFTFNQACLFPALDTVSDIGKAPH